MKKLWKRIIVSLLAVCMLLSVAGCAGGNQEEDPGKDSTAPSTDQKDPANEQLPDLGGFQFFWATGGPPPNTRKRNPQPHGIRWLRTTTTILKRR